MANLYDNTASNTTYDDYCRACATFFKLTKNGWPAEDKECYEVLLAEEVMEVFEDHMRCAAALVADTNTKLTK